MIIIIEGPDGAGKSTLAETLQKQTGYTLLHRSQPKTDEDKQRMMEEYLQVIKSGKNCIFDRSWYSEMVYGPIMRDTSVIDYPQMYSLERALAKTGALIIHCTAPVATLWKRCINRGETYIVEPDTLKHVKESFDGLMRSVPHLIPVVTYEYKDM